MEMTRASNLQLFIISHRPSFFCLYFFCNHPNHQQPSSMPSLEHGRPGAAKDQAVAKKALQTERAQKAREIEREQCKFLKNCTLADVLLDAENPKSLKGSTDTMAL
jgi:hypothetical protein